MPAALSPNTSLARLTSPKQVQATDVDSTTVPARAPFLAGSYPSATVEVVTVAGLADIAIHEPLTT